MLWSHDTAEEVRRARHHVGQERLAARGRRHGRHQRRRTSRLERLERRRDYDSSLVAFDIETGDVRWAAGTRKASYASPVLADLAGERQIIVVNESWVTAHRASDGKVLWEHPWDDENDHNASARSRCRSMAIGCFCRRATASARRCWRFERDAAGKFAAEPLWKPADQARDEDQVLQRRDARRLRLRPG